MTDYEKLGSFYLGRFFDHQTGQTTDDLLLYDSKDLTTHAVCVGMTGSGKTGLGIGLLEEAALDGIPAIVIDPKGDLGNMLLMFPDLNPSDFEPWLEPSEAARKGVPLSELAVKTAETWRKGLESWHQPVERIAKLKASAEISIYTPGNTSGRPLTVLRSFEAPPKETMEDASAMRDYTMSAVSGLLALVGISGDPLRSREHILLSSILDHYWKLNQDMDIPSLIHAVQKPPFSKVGVFDMDSFYPVNDRLELAMSLNNLIASPGFSVWTQGEPLNIQRLLYTTSGKPRISILSIAHLGESERMFFVTILLNAVLAWVRTQSGTSSLRALLYMDEIFGYFPPTANPPSKLPMLTLLKQARAFGLGVVLATQNPVDLDYKGLANTGTWLIGRLQTDRDKARVLDGLESAAQGSGQGFARSEMDQLLSGLGSRVFLLHNVHQTHPVLFQTRWAMSFLRGPLTLSQIKTLTGPSATPPEVPAAAPLSAKEAPVEPLAPAVRPKSPMAAQRPTPPPGVDEYFLRPKQAGASDLHYTPVVFAQARLHFVDAKSGVDTWETVQFVHPAVEQTEELTWNNADTVTSGIADVDLQPLAGSTFDALPNAAARPANYKMWQRMLTSYIYQEITMDLMVCPDLKISSKPNEPEGDFKSRLQVLLHEKRDDEMEKIRRKYAPKLTSLQEQLRKAEARVEKEKDQYGQQKVSTAISFGATILGALMGRGAMSVGTVGRASTAIKGVGRATREKRDIEMAQDSVEAVAERMDTMQQELDAEMERIKSEMDIEGLEISSTRIRPRKTDITLMSFGLGWQAV